MPTSSNPIRPANQQPKLHKNNIDNRNAHRLIIRTKNGPFLIIENIPGLWKN